MVSHLRRLAPLAVLGLLLAGCATNPVSGKRELSLVSSSQELAIGREGYPAVISEYGAYDDSTIQRYVQSVGLRVARVSHLPNLDWHFTVIDDDVVNAFAMPGGYIYVTRGILAHLNSEAQLAGVLGHEIGHVTARHSARQITRQQIAGLGLGVASLMSSTVAQYSNVAQQGLGLLFLSYSRDNETQADELGVQYATKAGYDPREIPKTYVMLGRISAASGQRLPNYLSTHPDPGDRKTRTTTLAMEALAGRTGLAVDGPSYVRRMQGIVFGHDPRQGYFEGDRYVHPGLRLAITFPSGWTHQDTRSAVTAAGGDRAQMQLTVAAAQGLSPTGFVARLAERGAIAGANGGGERIGGHEAWVGRLSVAAQDGSRSLVSAAFLAWSGDQVVEVLGHSASPGDEDDRRIFAAARSCADVTDAAHLEVRPDRVAVEPLPASGVFKEVVPRLGRQALAIEPTSILNNVMADDLIEAGRLLKIVVPGRSQ
jgi:predicted Zn-dependent protease